jgi:hypothetical protein
MERINPKIPVPIYQTVLSHIPEHCDLLITLPRERQISPLNILCYAVQNISGQGEGGELRLLPDKHCRDFQFVLMPANAFNL